MLNKIKLHFKDKGYINKFFICQDFDFTNKTSNDDSVFIFITFMHLFFH